MRKKFTLLIASLTLLSGSNLAWGQHGVLLPEYQSEQVSPRRGDAGTPGSVDYIVTPGNVNNEFGAGETATISNGSIIFPTGNGVPNNPPNAIQLGSEYSQNIVVNTYNAGGYASEWVSVSVVKLTTGSLGPWKPSSKGIPISHRNPDAITMANPWPSTYDTPTSPAVTAGNYTKDISERDQTFGQLNGIFAVKAEAISVGYDSYTDKTVQLYLVNHLGTNVHHWQVKATTTKLPYTVLLNATDSTDNGVKLVQVSGNELVSLSANPGDAPGTGTSIIKNYIRPTTIAVGGTNTLQNILFKDLGWWYHAHNIGEYSPGVYYQIGGPGSGTYPDLRGGCGHITGNPVVDVTAIKGWGRTKHQGNNYIDAAVQLMNGARVCVATNVLDQTNNITDQAGLDATYQRTNALVVLPIADRVTFRTAGNFKVNMAHERDSLMADNVKYTAADFPDPDPDIFLYSGGTTENFGAVMKSFSNPQYTTVVTKAPYLSTTSSIFGVNGNYLHTGNMADIHTDSTTYDNRNPGVIEVGTTTAGKRHFHIYGNGMLKNFEGCTTLANFPLYFGETKGGTPQLQINTNDTLYIVNFGNNGTNYCDADLLFHTTSVDSIKYAFTGSGAGALQIQALSDLRLRGNGVWNATTNGNNIHLLSDGGNVSTQKLDILSDNIAGTGHGLLTIWAETDPLTDACVGNSGTNRFSKSGNIYLNDAVTLVRAATNTTQTNLIAANNIRTASFSSINANNEDTTNIISRMGDLWLGYSAGTPIYSASDIYPTSNGLTGNDNVFSYEGTGNSGTLNLKAGYDDQNNTTQYGGGNIYFTHIDANMDKGKNHITNITIPFSNEYYCNSSWSGGKLHERIANNTMKYYEHAGIIGGVGRCGIDHAYADYGSLLEEGVGLAASLNNVADTSLIYRANHGQLLVDAGTRGNIIMNRGSYLDFQNNNANGFFLTRYGDIDMRYATDVENLEGSVLFLANSELANKLDVPACGCDEQRNNVYLQDFQFRIDAGNGSVFIGADNNIKLQYGGLRNIGTQRDPFLSEDTDYPCGSGKYHCDSDTAANQARDLILDFNLAATPGKGGFAAVASDLIDVYKNLEYTGGPSGQGMSSVPKYGSLHGENVAGYGLYIKTQANKKNWNKTDHDINNTPDPLQGAACETDICQSDAFLHKTARVTFHADARLYSENQQVYIGSPVLETFGNAEYNTSLNKGSKTSILIQADSLIYHDSLIIDGNKTRFTTWSDMYRNMPVIRLGHQRFTPAATETGCENCHTHTKGANGLDTVFVTFRNDAGIDRLHTLVAEHAVISFLTDSFDHKKGNPVLNAKIYTDTFKIRNHVELFRYADHTRDGHFELISEEQMESKDYAGIYSRHMHMEPIGPGCSDFAYSQLWLQDPALDVITTSTFGGFGWLHADVHVENQANLFPGYASLRHNGNCYEQKAGILRMKDLRLDKGANLVFSVGDKASPFVETYDCPKTFESINIGQYADCLDVDTLSIYGSIDLSLVIRPEGLILSPGESRCFPVIRYKSVEEGVLNNLKLKKYELTSKDHKSIDGKYYLTLDVDTECNIVYICIATIPDPVIKRPVTIPTIPGVTSNPAPGTYHVKSSGSFSFTLKFNTEQPLKVLTGRIINGEPEEIFGTKNANGEYVYIINSVKSPIQLSIGPDFASENPTSNEDMDQILVWAHNNTIYIKANKDDIASIYSVTGQLVKQIDLSDGNVSSIPMERGVYIITLNDGSVNKVIIK